MVRRGHRHSLYSQRKRKCIKAKYKDIKDANKRSGHGQTTSDKHARVERHLMSMIEATFKMLCHWQTVQVSDFFMVRRFSPIKDLEASLQCKASWSFQSYGVFHCVVKLGSLFQCSLVPLQSGWDYRLIDIVVPRYHRKCSAHKRTTQEQGSILMECDLDSRLVDVFHCKTKLFVSSGFVIQ